MKIGCWWGSSGYSLEKRGERGRKVSKLGGRGKRWSVGGFVSCESLFLGGGTVPKGEGTLNNQRGFEEKKGLEGKKHEGAVNAKHFGFSPCARKPAEGAAAHRTEKKLGSRKNRRGPYAQNVQCHRDENIGARKNVHGEKEGGRKSGRRFISPEWCLGNELAAFRRVSRGTRRSSSRKKKKKIIKTEKKCDKKQFVFWECFSPLGGTDSKRKRGRAVKKKKEDG